MRAITALAASLLVCALLPSGAAAALKLRDAGPIGTIVVDDGSRYIASAGSAEAITLFDTRTARRRTIPVTNTRCGLGGFHHATLLLTCTENAGYSSGLTYDLKTGRLAALAPPEHPPSFFPDGSEYIALGDRWAEARFYEYHGSYLVARDRVSGNQQTVQPLRNQVTDLDRVSMVRTLCSGQSRPSVPNADSGLGVVLGDLATAGRWAAGTTYEDVPDPVGRVELQHCGTKPRTLRSCKTVGCSQPVINDQVVAWTEYHARKVAAGHLLSSRIVVRSLETGRTRASRSRTSAGLRQMVPLLVGHRLYVAVDGRLKRVKI